MADYEREVIQSVCHCAQRVKSLFEVAAETFKVAIIWICLCHAIGYLTVWIVQLPQPARPLDQSQCQAV